MELVIYILLSAFTFLEVYFVDTIFFKLREVYPAPVVDALSLLLFGIISYIFINLRLVSITSRKYAVLYLSHNIVFVCLLLIIRVSKFESYGPNKWLLIIPIAIQVLCLIFINSSLKASIKKTVSFIVQSAAFFCLAFFCSAFTAFSLALSGWILIIIYGLFMVIVNHIATSNDLKLSSHSNHSIDSLT